MIWLQSGRRCSVAPYTPHTLELTASTYIVRQYALQTACNRNEAGCEVDLLRGTAKPTFQSTRALAVPG